VAVWFGAALVVAALVGGLVGALLTARSIAPEDEAGTVRVVSPSDRQAPAAAPFLPAGQAPRAPVVAASAPKGPAPLAVPAQRVGEPRLVLAVVDDETGAPVTAYDALIMPAAGDPPLQRARTTEVRPHAFRGVSGILRADCKAGHWDVVVRAPGYLPAVLPDVVVPSAQPGAIALRLSHGPSITGLVYDATRAPVADVPVFLDIVRLFAEGEHPAVQATRTGGDGRFRFAPLPAGEYSLALLEPDNAGDRLPSVLVIQGTTDVSLFLAPRHQVVVSVRDIRGRPVSDAEVEVRGGARYASSRTQDSGQAVLRFLPDGEYELSARREGYEPFTEPLQLQGGQGELVRWVTLQESG